MTVWDQINFKFLEIISDKKKTKIYFAENLSLTYINNCVGFEAIPYSKPTSYSAKPS